MSDFARINEPRVLKLVAMLETIQKSARSNGVGAAEMQQLLAPLRAAMGHAPPPGILPPGLPAPAPASRMIERRDITLWNEAKTAPLDELMMAYTTITSRLVDEVTP